ncbi:phage tail tape measure protein [Arsenophonus sp. PmNCSU2021_1]|uniref:phage tail tape measure protein n=1 Tax=Arsenophonus sp. PmNCSU2021_1 TaxID=3118989 RepID=UPI002FF27114
MSQVELKAVITAKDRLSPKLSELQKKIKKFRKESAVISRGGIGMAAGLAGGATASLIAFAKQEDAATSLKSAMMEANGQVAPTFNKINQLALKLGNKLPGTTADFQNMMQMLVRQGIPAENILNGVGQASAYLAVQLKKPPEEAAEFAAKMRDATGTASKDMLTLFDTMQRMSYLGLKDSDMLQFFVKSSSVLKMISQDGLKAAQALAPIGVLLGNAGMAGEESGNAVRKVLQAGLDVKKVRGVNKHLLRQYKIKLDFTDKKGSFGGLDNFFAQLDKLNKLKEDTKKREVIKALFGDDNETLSVVNKLLEKGAAGYDEIVSKMRRQADLNRRVEMQLGTLTNLWDAMTGTATNGLASIGRAFEKDTKATTKWLGDLSGRFDEFVTQHPNVVRSAVGIAAGLTTVKLAVWGLRAALIALGTSTPIGWVLTAIGVALGAIAANWEDVKNAFSTEETPKIKKQQEEIKKVVPPEVLNTHRGIEMASNSMGLIQSPFSSSSLLPPKTENSPQKAPNTIGLMPSPFAQNFSTKNTRSEAQDKAIEKLRLSVPSREQKLQLQVDFNNAPLGMTVKPEGKQPSWFDLDFTYKGYNRFARP